MKVETVHVATRNPRNDEDPGECAIVHFVVENNVVNVTDKDGHMLRYPDGEPCRRALELGSVSMPDGEIASWRVFFLRYIDPCGRQPRERFWNTRRH